MPQKRIFSIEIQLILIFGMTPSLNFGAILSHVNKSIEIQLKPEIKQKYPDFNCDKLGAKFSVMYLVKVSVQTSSITIISLKIS